MYVGETKNQNNNPALIKTLCYSVPSENDFYSMSATTALTCVSL